MDCPRAVVIGYGNPSRMDDGVGHWVINRLSEQLGLTRRDLLDEGGVSAPVLFHGVELRLVWMQQLDMGLAELLAECDWAALVDVHLGGAEQLVVDLVPECRSSVISHALEPETLLALTAACHGRSPAARRYSVRGERFDFDDQLTPDVAVRTAALLERIVADLALVGRQAA